MDKIVHFVFYFVFTTLLVLVLKYEAVFLKNTTKVYLFAFFCSLLLGVMIEGLQSELTITRKGDVFDVLFNTFGTVVAILLMMILARRKK